MQCNFRKAFAPIVHSLYFSKEGARDLTAKVAKAVGTNAIRLHCLHTLLPQIQPNSSGLLLHRFKTQRKRRRRKKIRQISMTEPDEPLAINNTSAKTYENNSRLRQDMDSSAGFNWNYMYSILIGGIDFDLPGNGGTECWNFMTLKRRLIETVLGLIVTSSALVLGKICRKVEFKSSNR